MTILQCKLVQRFLSNSIEIIGTVHLVLVVLKQKTGASVVGYDKRGLGIYNMCIRTNQFY
jgi:hypothetical protein